jgi:hypothetical protein
VAERPLGVTILGFLSLVSGAFSIIKGLAWLGIGGLAAGATAIANPVVGAMIGIVALAFGGLALLSGIFALLVAWGFFTTRKWAWGFGMATHGFILAWSLLAVLGPSTLRERLGAIIVSGCIVYYLTRTDIKQAFGKL